VALAALDNSTVIHGQIHPMVAMLSLGGCELLQLRRRSCQKRDLREQSNSPAKEASPHCLEQQAAASLEDQNHSVCSESRSPTSPDHYKEGIADTLDGAESASSDTTDHSHSAAGELEVVFHTQPKKLKGAAGESVVLGRNAMDTDIDATNTFEAVESQISVQCASARQGDIVILVSAELAANPMIESCVAICNEMVPPSTSGSAFSPTSPELLRKLAHRIAEEAVAKHHSELGAKASAPGDVACTPTKDNNLIPASVVVAEVVEMSADHSRSTPSPEPTPEKVDSKAIHALPASKQRRMREGITPILEGHDEMKAFQCMMGFGNYELSLSVDVPKVKAPKWPLRRSLTNDFIGEPDWHAMR